MCSYACNDLETKLKKKYKELKEIVPIPIRILLFFLYKKKKKKTQLGLFAFLSMLIKVGKGCVKNRSVHISLIVLTLNVDGYDIEDIFN